MWAPGPTGNMRRHVLIHLRSRRCAWIRHQARPSAFPIFAAGDLVILDLILLNPFFLNPISFPWC
eukprot:13195980-Heterocapsa_arctica.AAC.1